MQKFKRTVIKMAHRELLIRTHRVLQSNKNFHIVDTISLRQQCRDGNGKMKLVKTENLDFFHISLVLFLTFFRITRHENCDVHFRAVLVFVVWEKGGMGLLI